MFGIEKSQITISYFLLASSISTSSRLLTSQVLTLHCVTDFIIWNKTLRTSLLSSITSTFLEKLSQTFLEILFSSIFFILHIGIFIVNLVPLFSADRKSVV